MKYYLDFTYGRIEILEPIGYDGSNTKIEQEDKRFARDVMYGSQNVKLRFVVGDFGDETEPYILDNGVIVRHLGSGAVQLLEENRNFGSEADVKFVIVEDTEEFSMALLFSEAETDDNTYIEMPLIMEDVLAVYKRQEKKPIDLFSDKDLEGNTIEPVNTLRVLFEAKPITQVSVWAQSRRQFATGSPTNMVALGAGFNYYNPCQAILSYGIEDTLANFDTVFGFSTIPEKARFVRAKTELTKLKLSVKTDITHHHRFNDIADPFGNPSRSRFIIMIGKSTDGNTLTQTQGIYANTIQQDYAVNFKIPELIQADVNFTLNQGEYFLIWIESPATIRATSVDYNNTAISSFLTFNNCDFTLTATSTGVSSVTDVVRKIDAIKQINKSIGTLPTIAPRFDVGGEWYNNVLITGKLIRQIKNEPFLISLEDLKKDLNNEFNSDYEISKTQFFVGHERDFYANNEIGVFETMPDKDFKKPKNDRFLINAFNFAYDDYEKDKDEKNTRDSIHTEAKFSILQKKGENSKDIKCPFGRDPFLGETIRRRNTLSTTTAYDTDDKILQYEITQIAPNSRRKINFILSYESVTGGDLRILANETFRWDLLGFSVGDVIKINGLNFTVTAITPNILTLPAQGTASGEERIEIDYPLTNVTYVIRTNQGLVYSENLLDSENFANLNYSIKRSIERNYSEYLATALLFTENKMILNNEFKNNGKCTTRFAGEVENVIENADFTVDLSKRILSQNLIETTVPCDLKKANEIILKAQTIRGFLRIIDSNGRVIRGYIKDFDRNSKFNELDLILEEKFESDLLVITYDGTLFTINDAGYDSQTVTERRYNIYNDKIQFFDKNNLILCNRTPFNKVQYNGIIYNSVDDLVNALENG